MNNVGILDITTDNWIWYIQGADRVAKVVPTPAQQPKNIATATALQLSDTLQTSFYLYDHLGNTRIVYNTVGTVCGSDIAYTVEYAGVGSKAIMLVKQGGQVSPTFSNLTKILHVK